MKELNQQLDQMGHWFDDLETDMFMMILKVATENESKEKEKEAEDRRNAYEEVFKNIPYVGNNNYKRRIGI